MNRREKRFRANLANILGGWENGRMDDPDNYPLMTEQQWIDYVFPDVYNLWAEDGAVYYGRNICGDLRFLGRRKMEKIILEEVHKEGWVK